MENKIILAIESSCDETSAAVVVNGRDVLSNIIASQIDTHKKFGGVVPEVASRMHIEVINSVVSEALKVANKTLDDIEENFGKEISLLVDGISRINKLAFI